MPTRALYPIELLTLHGACGHSFKIFLGHRSSFGDRSSLAYAPSEVTKNSFIDVIALQLWYYPNGVTCLSNNPCRYPSHCGDGHPRGPETVRIEHLVRGRDPVLSLKAIHAYLERSQAGLTASHSKLRARSLACACFNCQASVVSLQECSFCAFRLRSTH